MNMHAADGIHVDDGALLALIDGESAPGAEPRTHVDSCDDCARRMEELRFASRRLAGALESVDTPSPLTEMPDELRDAAAAAVTPIHSAWRRRLRGGRSVAAAAGLILVLAAGAYAVPGSPLRSIVSRSVDALGSLFGGDTVGPIDPGPSAVGVDPVDGAVTVSIEGATDDLRVTIRLVDTSRASVSARGASFVGQPGRLRVTDAAGDMTVELPTAAEGTVEVNGAPVARSTGGAITRLPGADLVPAVIVVETAG
ncbi:MAG: hypothetical protein OEU54_03215 [Gemmatimonadota bacterium]|nr:hypothetical protein [Gemmatimonadota bacterium]